MNKRSRKLINESFFWYLVPMLLSSAALTILAIVDSIIMGRFLGPDAFSAINVSVPLLNGVGTFGVLVISGAAAIVSQKIGERDMDSVQRIFSASVVSILVVAILKILVGLFFLDPLAALVCKEPELLPLVKDYCRVSIIFGFIADVNMAMCRFASVSGYPRGGVKCDCVLMAVNITLDLIFVGVFHMGVAGAAWATVAANTAGALVLVPYYFRRDRFYRFRPSGILGQIPENLSQGIPLALGVLGGSVLTFSMNYFVQINLRSDGLFVVSVFLIIASFALLISGAVNNAFVAMGELLTGQKDKDGLHILLRTCIIIIVASTGVLALITYLAPGYLAQLFGADTEELMALSKRGLQILSLCLVAQMMAPALSAVYQVTGKIKMSTLVLILSMGLMPLVMGVMTMLGTPEMIWYAPTVSAVLCLLIILIVSEAYRRKHRDLSFFFLLPSHGEEIKHFEISIPAETEDMGKALHTAKDFFESLNVDAEQNLRIRLCTEEILTYIVSGERKNEGDSIDVIITAGSDDVVVMVKDDGMPYNPLHVSKDDDFELMILNHFCPHVEYQYCYGQNMTFLTWPVSRKDQ